MFFCLKKNGDRPWISVYFFCNRGNTDCVYTYRYCYIVSCLCKGWFCGPTCENMRRVLKCAFTYDRVWLSWGDPVQLTWCSDPITNYLNNSLGCTQKLTVLFEVHPSHSKRSHKLFLQVVLKVHKDGGQVFVWVVGDADGGYALQELGFREFACQVA